MREGRTVAYPHCGNHRSDICSQLTRQVSAETADLRYPAIISRGSGSNGRDEGSTRSRRTNIARPRPRTLRFRGKETGFTFHMSTHTLSRRHGTAVSCPSARSLSSRHRRPGLVAAILRHESSSDLGVRARNSKSKCKIKQCKPLHKVSLTGCSAQV
jgi:hypothetical protein